MFSKKGDDLLSRQKRIQNKHPEICAKLEGSEK